MGEFDELKNNLSKIIENRDAIPQEVVEMVEKVFTQIEEIYDNNRCNNSTISEGIYTEMKSVQTLLKSKIGNNKKEQQYGEIMVALNAIEKRIDETQQSQLPEDESAELRNESYRKGYEQLAEVKCDNREIVARIMDLVMCSLRDINNRQNRILQATGQLSEERIDDIQQQVLEAIQGFQNKDEEIFMILEENDRMLIGTILEQYTIMIDEPKKSKQEEFRDSLDAGISYDEQSENAKAFRENVVDEKPSQSREDLYAQFR